MSSNTILLLNLCALLIGLSIGCGLWAMIDLFRRLAANAPAKRLSVVPLLFKLFLPLARFFAPFFQKPQWEGLFRGRRLRRRRRAVHGHQQAGDPTQPDAGRLRRALSRALAHRPDPGAAPLHAARPAERA